MDWARLAGAILTVLASGYAAAAWWASRRPLPTPAVDSDDGLAPVTVLKPLCGDEPRLYRNLASFCRQRHPCFQLVFGVSEPDDAALLAVERLRRAFPGCDIAVAVGAQRLVPALSNVAPVNPKVANLIAMLPLARHERLVIADSDIAVRADYLRRVTAPLADPRVGIVTCLYRGRPLRGAWARLGAQFIDEWFVPAVRVAQAGGSQRFGFGATIALRREALLRIGGFAAVADRLADDYWLGELTRRQGLRTVLSDVEVRTDIAETTPRALWSHELRWLRTLRGLDPAGFALVFLTFTWPMLAFGLLLASSRALALVAALGALARSLRCRDAGAALRAPLRDTLLLLEWTVAMAGRQVRWRGTRLAIEWTRDGMASAAARADRPRPHDRVDRQSPSVSRRTR
ncbi:bacteriohopanetetrol glucosamine biosynthesis glycosyltransferase HpnI [Cupriavidus gilardii]|uniref:Bacteriohopanetetrol glucosamine biosynthesis glycosyltransferase HpnI n=1 Tax=Cupriavidus gilardii TaxID=82541 RepID=A0ABY4VK48_9BURK|nr:bacteriohopanetetrol glucosamine biosynthesis glycosyltransferase HpnI [Cupriavidus gilardii]MCT9118073.1 bacteriohopanetetrol glucosamine biosynthesis glycosyltransferase HpnI [Cupriavidus gilardii]USE77366.1 bacteriohopanetetrol glucosamine biosynthesis glycosyltransferase HpnI [Cupriavidus gilardii]